MACAPYTDRANFAHTGTTARAAQDEAVHTTANHPWLTTDRGWVLAGDLQAGEPVRTLDGQTAIVAWVHTVPGQADYYNLTVADDHTYAVGDGQYVVHNGSPYCAPGDDRVPDKTSGDGTPTRGVLDRGIGPSGETDLESWTRAKKDVWEAAGSDTPALGGKWRLDIAGHVEGQAAQIMRDEGLSEATWWINNTPCTGAYGCNKLLPDMLPEGSRLIVQVKIPGGGEWDARPPYVGRPDSEWTWPPQR